MSRAARRAHEKLTRRLERERARFLATKELTDEERVARWLLRAGTATQERLSSGQVVGNVSTDRIAADTGLDDERVRAILLDLQARGAIKLRGQDDA